MEILEDLGGCAVMAIVGIVILLLIAFVAVIFLGVSLPNIIG